MKILKWTTLVIAGLYVTFGAMLIWHGAGKEEAVKECVASAKRAGAVEMSCDDWYQDCFFFQCDYDAYWPVKLGQFNMWFSAFNVKHAGKSKEEKIAILREERRELIREYVEQNRGK